MHQSRRSHGTHRSHRARPNYLTWQVSTHPDSLTKSDLLREAEECGRARPGSLAVACALVIGVIAFACLVSLFPVRPCGAARGVSGRKSDTRAPSVVEVKSDAELDELIKTSPKCFVMYMADFCHHCRETKPAFMEADAKVPAVQFALADCNGVISREIMSREDIKGFPTLVLYERGKRAGVFAGARTAESMVKFCANE